MARSYWRSLGLAVFAATAALALSACGGSSSPTAAGSATVASLSTSSKGSADTAGRSTTTKQPKGNATKLVDEWATCERTHGDPNQSDPIIDAHGVINITVPAPGHGGPAGNPHGVAGTCSEYLAGAQRALRAADPVQDPLGMTNQADLLKYVNCMRASGVPNYPYPTGNTTNFNGTGVDPNSPYVVKVSIECGNRLGLPLWWSAGWGPPGDVSVSMTPPPGAHAPGPLVTTAGPPNGAAPPGPAASGANAGG
jgi:hypothetical protein